METEQIAPGIEAYTFLEREAGGPHHIAVVLADLGSAVEGALGEFKYGEDNAVERDLTAALNALEFVLGRVSMTAKGELTYWRECGRCSGGGKTHGEDPCVECQGRGAVHAEED